MNRKSTTAWLTLLLAAALQGCGGDSLQTGIDGTGNVKAPVQPIVASGRVRSFGSVEVNGTHYDTATATILIDGKVATQADLKLGNILLVEGSVDPATSKATATRVSSEHVLQGAVQSIEVAGRVFTVLGQAVRVTDETLFDSATASLPGLAPGNGVDVSGFRTLDGAIVATRVDRQPADAAVSRLAGAVTAADPAASRFDINSLHVDYSRAALLPAGSIVTPQRGDFVDVRGALDSVTGRLVATSVEIRRKRIEAGADSRAEIEGFLTSVDATDATRFEVNGIPVATNASTAFAGALSVNAAVSVKGAVTSGGAVVASNVQTGFAVPVATVPDNLRIRVFDAVGGPVPAVAFNLWIELPSGSGYSYNWSSGAGGSLKTGSDGSFVASVPVGAKASVLVYSTDYAQPCGAQTQVTATTSLEVEVMNVARLQTADAPAPQGVSGAVLTGTVYETTSGGRRPIAGATLWAAEGLDLYYARTVSDANGRYLLCRLRNHERNPGTGIEVQKTGFANVDLWPVESAQSSVRDIEMTRVP